MMGRVPEGWEWDPTLFAGSAPFYERGRLPYPAGLADECAAALALDGRGRLLDVGCGPGIVAFELAHLFAEIVGLDADGDMVAEASRRAHELGVGNARWVHALAEDVDPDDLGQFRVVTMAQSFHWMERGRVAAIIRRLLEPGGALVHVSGQTVFGVDEPTVPLPFPRPPHDELKAVVRRRLGSVPRAGQGYLRHGTPSGEAEVLRAAGFAEPDVIVVPGGEVIERSADDVVAGMWSMSGSAPHLFADDLPAVEAELRAVLHEASPSGRFAEQLDDTELVVYRTPQQ